MNSPHHSATPLRYASALLIAFLLLGFGLAAAGATTSGAGARRPGIDFPRPAAGYLPRDRLERPGHALPGRHVQYLFDPATLQQPVGAGRTRAGRRRRAAGRYERRNGRVQLRRQHLLGRQGQLLDLRPAAIQPAPAAAAQRRSGGQRNERVNGRAGQPLQSRGRADHAVHRQPTYRAPALPTDSHGRQAHCDRRDFWPRPRSWRRSPTR